MCRKITVELVYLSEKNHNKPFNKRNAPRFKDKFNSSYTSLYKCKKDPPCNLTCVYFFICIQHRGETLGTKVVKKHHQLKIAEIPLFDIKMVSVLPGYSASTISVNKSTCINTPPTRGGTHHHWTKWKIAWTWHLLCHILQVAELPYSSTSRSQITYAYQWESARYCIKKKRWNKGVFSAKFFTFTTLFRNHVRWPNIKRALDFCFKGTCFNRRGRFSFGHDYKPL